MQYILLLAICIVFSASLSASCSDQPASVHTNTIARLDVVAKELENGVQASLDHRSLELSQAMFCAKQEGIKRSSRELKELIHKITIFWPQLTEDERNTVRQSLHQLSPFTKCIYGMDTNDEASLENQIFQFPNRAH